MDLIIYGFPSNLSHEAFPRGFPTGLSLEPPLCASILGVKVEAVQGKQVPLEWTETFGDSGNVGTTLQFLWPFLLRAPPPVMRRERREFCPDQAGKGSLISSYEAETVLLWMWPGPSCFLSSGDGCVGNFLSCRKGVKDPLEVPGVRCD